MHAISSREAGQHRRRRCTELTKTTGRTVIGEEKADAVLRTSRCNGLSQEYMLISMRCIVPRRLLLGPLYSLLSHASSVRLVARPSVPSPTGKTMSWRTGWKIETLRHRLVPEIRETPFALTSSSISVPAAIQDRHPPFLLSPLYPLAHWRAGWGGKAGRGGKGRGGEDAMTGYERRRRADS